MWRPPWSRSGRASVAEPAPATSRRDRVAVFIALATVVSLGAVFLLSRGTQFLMPGPLTSAHSAIQKCSTCHTKSGSNNVSWIHGLIAGDPLADGKACLTCHKMPDTAFNAHGASAEVLQESTKRLTKIAAQTPQPPSATAQSFAIPPHDMAAGNLPCATCHQEHQGAGFDLSRISNEQCRSCHVVKFDSFDGHHPKFEAYPFKRRTRIVFDHAAHFGKHYPEVAKKDPAKQIPATCSTCHDSGKDRRVMAVAPFDRTCSACHLDQIVGKERVSGPKGIAFLTLPGLDVDTLKQKNAAIGEWPEASEAELTPFMKVMIGRDQRGRDLIKAVAGLNLQDLSKASDAEVQAVASLAWEIKQLFYALIKGKASDVLGDLNIGGGAKLSAALVADLTASIPRDVVVGAQQQWLPNLATEMANRPPPPPAETNTDGWSTTIKQESRALSPGAQAAAEAPTTAKPPRDDKKLPPPVRAGIPVAAIASALQDNGRSRPSADGATTRLAADDSGGPVIRRWDLPSGTARSIEARNKKPEKESAPDESDTDAKSPAGSKARPPAESPGAQPAATIDAEQPDKVDATNAAQPSTAQPGNEPRKAQGEATEQTDDLLFPSEAELRAMKDGTEAEATAAPPAGSDTAGASAPGAAAASASASDDASSSVPADAAAAPPSAQAAPVVAIESDVDPESWAEYGGWYRQDYAIFYRPVGHKDKFVFSWLTLTGPQASKGSKGSAAAVFDYLTGKEAQGSCTKCHSVDDISGKGRLVNFSPPSAASKRGGFTQFVHEPHFGVMEDRGCLTCHALAKERPYLKSYEQGNPQSFASNFAPVKKDLCQTCHATSMARQDCLLCHKYHVNGVVTPILSTKLPKQ